MQQPSHSPDSAFYSEAIANHAAMQHHGSFSFGVAGPGLPLSGGGIGQTLYAAPTCDSIPPLHVSGGYDFGIDSSADHHQPIQTQGRFNAFDPNQSRYGMSDGGINGPMEPMSRHSGPPMGPAPVPPPSPQHQGFQHHSQHFHGHGHPYSQMQHGPHHYYQPFGSPGGNYGGGRGRGRGMHSFNRGGSAFGPIGSNPAKERHFGNTGGRGQSARHYCELCKVSCAGPQAFKEHLDGQKHKKKEIAQQLEAAGIAANPKPEVVSKKLGNVTSADKVLRCELCEVSCTGVDAYSAHVRGKQHSRTLKLHKELGKPIPESNAPLVSKALAAALTKRPSDIAEESSSKDPKTEENGDKSCPAGEAGYERVELDKLMVNEPTPIGHEFIEEIKAPNTEKVLQYRCSLCDCHFNDSNTKDLHLKGRRHRLAYRKKVDPTFEIESKSQKRSSANTTSNNQKAPQTSRAQPVAHSHCVEQAYSNKISNSFSTHPYPQPMFESNQSSASAVAFNPIGAFLSGQPMLKEDLCILQRHSTIIPNEAEMAAVRISAGSCERALKMLSDCLMESIKSKAVDKDNPELEEETKETKKPLSYSTCDDHRVLRGVVRVGLLGKSLLLTGERQLDLVLMCSTHPSIELVHEVAESLPHQLKLTNPDLTVSLDASSASQGLLLLDILLPRRLLIPSVGKRPRPATNVIGSTEQSSEHQPIDSSTTTTEEANNGERTHVQGDNEETVSASGVNADKQSDLEDIRVTLNIQFASDGPENEGEVGGDTPGKIDASNESPTHPWSIGTPVPTEFCQAALESARRTKLFQAKNSSLQSLGVVARVLRSFVRANKQDWQALDDELIELILMRLVDLECPLSSNMGKHGLFHQPNGGNSGASSGRTPVLACRPSRLLRRFFEALSSGLLLSCYAHLTTPASLSTHASNRENSGADESGSEYNTQTGSSCFRGSGYCSAAGPSPNSADCSQFYHHELLSKLLATSTLTHQQREDLTFFAHRDLRRLAFRQHCQLLNVDPASLQNLPPRSFRGHGHFNAGQHGGYRSMGKRRRLAQNQASQADAARSTNMVSQNDADDFAAQSTSHTEEEFIAAETTNCIIDSGPMDTSG